MRREEALGLRISIAMHVALLMALGTDGKSDKQEVEAQEVELVVLPTKMFQAEGDSLTKADDDCNDRRPRRSSSGVAVNLDIAEGLLSVSLRALSQQTGLAYAVDAALLENQHSTVLHGLFTPSDAVDRLLAGTALCAHWIEGSLVIMRCAVTFREKRNRHAFGANDRALTPCDSADPAPQPRPQPLPRTSIA